MAHLGAEHFANEPSGQQKAMITEPSDDRGDARHRRRFLFVSPTLASRDNTASNRYQART